MLSDFATDVGSDDWQNRGQHHTNIQNHRPTHQYESPASFHNTHSLFHFWSCFFKQSFQNKKKIYKWMDASKVFQMSENTSTLCQWRTGSPPRSCQEAMALIWQPCPWKCRTTGSRPHFYWWPDRSLPCTKNIQQRETQILGKDVFVPPSISVTFRLRFGLAASSAEIHADLVSLDSTKSRIPKAFSKLDDETSGFSFVLLNWKGGISISPWHQLMHQFGLFSEKK